MMKIQKLELPSGYVKCKYLESNGTQNINIAFDETLLIDFSIKIQPALSSPSWSSFFEIKYVDSAIFSMVRRAYPANIYIPTDDTSNYSIVGSGGIFDDNTILTISYKNKHIFINDALDLAWSKGYEKQIDSLSLFGSTNCKIFEYNLQSDSPIIKLLPCLDMINRPCMYDTVSQQAFYNLGTGEFGYELLDGTYVAPV